MLDSGLHLKGSQSVNDWRKRIPQEDKDAYKKIDLAIEETKQKIRAKPENYTDTKLRSIATAVEKLKNDQKKLLYKYDFKRFVDEVIKDELQDKTPTPWFHVDMYNAYQQAKRVCVVCPRSHGKSSCARIYILHQILNRNVTQILIIGSNESMAAQNLRWVRDQISTNPRIIEIYGNLQDKAKWSETEFLTTTGIKVVAKGAGQKVRGENDRGRPDLIYVDDLEDDEAVRNRDSRQKLMSWFQETVMPLRSKSGRFIMTGTILDNDSLLKNVALNKVRDHIEWKVLWYQALTRRDDGSEVALWEDMHPANELKELRKISPDAFAQEYQNNPSSGQQAVFKREWFRHYDRSLIEISNTGTSFYDKQELHVMLTTDFAISEKEGSDWTVLMVSGMDSAGRLYILDMNRFRTSDPYDMISEIFVLVKKWHIEYVSIEVNVFQRALQRQMEREMELQKVHFLIHELQRPPNMQKLTRIKSVAPPIRLGKVFWDEDHVELEDELMQITATRLGKHDDVADCFVRGTLIATKRGNVPIENINDLDYALTPFGYRKIIIHGITRTENIITKLGCTGTKDHPFFTFNNGWATMDSLTDTSDVDNLCLRSLLQWKYKKLLSLMDGRTDLWVEKNIILVSRTPIEEESIQRDFMLRFGSLMREQRFRKAFAFTTKTATLLIMTSITWSVFRTKNTVQDILLKIKRLFSNTLRKSGHSQKNGTLVKREKNGIAPIVSNVGKESHQSSPVYIAERTWKHFSQQKRNSVLAPVGINIEKNQDCIEKYSSANIAKKNIQANIKQIDNHSSALLNAEIKQEVYNLHVEGCHVYYANNILVHNCLCDSWSLQIEVSQENGSNEPKINSFDWCIAQGMFPTVEEQESRNYARRKVYSR